MLHFLTFKTVKMFAICSVIDIIQLLLTKTETNTMETWEDFEQASEQGGIAKVAEEFKSVSKQIEDLEERRDKLKAMLEGEFSQDMGEQSKQAGSYLITLNRQERWSWDKDVLIEIYQSPDAMPDFIKKTFSIDRRKWKTLSDDDQTKLLPALTRKPGAVKIVVKSGGIANV